MKRAAIAGITLALMTTGAAAQSSGSAEVQLKTAMHKELVDGDLNAAIDQYKKLLKRTGLSRADTAKVLLHLGECYEKQGNAEARKAYERLVKEYSDQHDSAVEATQRLAALGATPHTSAMTLRQFHPPAEL